MHKQFPKFTGWLTPLPEEEYLRIVYVGKLKTLPGLRVGSNKDLHNNNLKDINDTINEIWDVSKVWNSTHGISGHLAYTDGRWISQLIEGKAEEITSLMAKIRGDSRVVIYKEFRRKLQSMNHGWNVQMCYSFDLTNEQYQLIADDDITPEQMFQSMRNTYQIRRAGWKLREFYKTVVETFLLKYISMYDNVKI